jgi:hypothetical protein
MLPSVNAQQWNVLADNWILIGICANLNRAGLGVFDKPRPTAALDTCESCVELGLKGGEVAIGGVNCGLSISEISIA